MPFCFSIYNSAVSAHIPKWLKGENSQKLWSKFPPKAETVWGLGLRMSKSLQKGPPKKSGGCVGFLLKIKLKLRLKLSSWVSLKGSRGMGRMLLLLEPNCLNSTLNNFIFIALFFAPEQGQKRIISTKALRAGGSSFCEESTPNKHRRGKNIESRANPYEREAVSTRGSFTQPGYFWHSEDRFV